MDEISEIAQQKAEQWARDLQEIIRVMSLVEGAGFEDSLPQDLQIREVPGEPKPDGALPLPRCHLRDRVVAWVRHRTSARRPNQIVQEKDGSEAFDFEFPSSDNAMWN